MNFKPLQKGDIVDIISPATPCTKDEIEKIKSFIRSLGLVPSIFLENELTLKKPATHEFPAADAETRFEQFKEAIENSESNIIWCARGGYGSADIVPFLHKMKQPKNQKIFIGFSDLVSVTTFLQQNWGWEIICAPMLGQITLDGVEKKSQDAIVNLLFGQKEKLHYELLELTAPQQRETINAPIVGGCISVLAGQFGTKNQLDWDDKILFLEDEGEDGERLERYFNQTLAILLEKRHYPKAILLGNFLEANPHGTPKSENIDMAITRFVNHIHTSGLAIPVFCETSRSLGHAKNMLPLMLGFESEIIGQSLIQKIQ